MNEIVRKMFSDENLKKNKTFMFLGMLFILLALLVIMAAGKLTSDINTANETRAKISEMEMQVNDFKHKAEIINNASLKPVAPDQVDEVQADIMHKVKSMGLTLEDCKVNDSSGQDINFKSYEMSINGPYEKVIKFLQEFGSRDALILLAEIDLNPVKNNIQAKFSYRIYVK